MYSPACARRVKPFWRPPSLLARQAGGALLMAYLAGWRKFPVWLFTRGRKAIPVSNGALGMGCIGYPGHPVWEVTSRCNLKCIHCHAGIHDGRAPDLTTDEGKRLIDGLAEIEGFRTLVFTGGEPLVRPDLFDLLRHAQSLGFANIIATNGTLIDDETAHRLKDCGVVCNAISLDAADPDIHNTIRQSSTAYDRALRGMAATRKAGILLQVNTTAMAHNREQLGDLIDLADRQGAAIMLMYQLVAVGRGEKIADATLKKWANRELNDLIADKQKGCGTIIEPVAGPQYWAHLLEKKGWTSPFALKLAGEVFHGCAAGRGFLYIKADGNVWPCPFVEISTGNVRNRSIKDIYDSAPLFVALRDRENRLEGACGTCSYRSLCGGCRGRAHAYSGNVLAEDPRCFLRETADHAHV